VALDWNIVGWISKDHSSLLTGQERCVGVRNCRVSADQAVGTDGPDVTGASGRRTGGRFWNIVGRIARSFPKRQFTNEGVDLCEFKPRDGEIQIDVEFGQIFEFEPKELAVPTRVLCQPVV